MVLRKGRLKENMLRKVYLFTTSIKKDKVIAEYDILQSKVHALALSNAGIISGADLKSLITGLDKIKNNLKKDDEYLDGDYDDIHMAIEDKLGEIGKKLHAGRSRNDQVACDMRMYIRDNVKRLIGLIEVVIDNIHTKSLKEDARLTYLPAYTHMQRAQAIDLATYLGVYMNWFKRDVERFEDSLKRINVLPLGSGAGAGTGIKLDREFIAKELGFDNISSNVMDAVSSKDYLLEVANTILIFAIHCSRLAEEFIIFASKEFSYIELDDSIADTSSIMPQKKNPDCLELIRSAAGRVIGVATGLAAIMKGLPLTYNRDMQDDRIIIESIQTAVNIADLLPDIFSNITFNVEKMREATRSGFIDAADFVEYLVMKKGFEFRTAHQKTAELVRIGIDADRCNIADIPLDDIRKVVPETDESVFDFISISNSIQRRLYGSGD